MAGVLVWIVAAGVESVHEKLQARRSPLLPVPTIVEEGGSSEALSATPSATTFTVRDLKIITREWQHRSIALSAKVRGLEICRREGWPLCWAGRVEELPAVRRARDEALWVAEKLESAVQWTKDQKVQKRAYLALPRSSKPRPSHSAFPPSLVDLPWPLPLAPELHRYHLTVPRPVFVAPPPYTEDVNQENGESSVMSGEAPSYQ
ncbi:hypothetical protein BCR35DRAFT_309568 [Leucosporidium creatinivorum]|uniref:Uncharacterized protein n=1 Tax=Leucosporidium creatinivorum TaxID=106004 RepID=A0A1Y2DEZ2_9BASI|nr:hypothetical protein BCR35DRAFT_309568 [Leucosporidium creatinivorum]